MTTHDMDTPELRELALFAGGGGGLYGSHLLGWRPVCAVEWEPSAQQMLIARQRDGTFPPFAIWDDVRSFDGTAWRGAVDVVTGGFPCQPFSVAGKRQAGDDLRNGWPDTARIIGEVVPGIAYLENVPGLIAGAHGYGRTVLGDLADLGFDAVWATAHAAGVGAPHHRARVWILAWRSGDDQVRGWLAQYRGVVDRARAVRQRGSDRRGAERRGDRLLPARVGAAGAFADPDEERREEHWIGVSASQADRPAGWAGPWSSEPLVDRVDHGVADRRHRLAALGNGQVPLAMAHTFIRLADRAARVELT